MLYRVLRTVLLDSTLCYTECLEQCCWIVLCAIQSAENFAAGKYLVLYRVLRTVLLDTILCYTNTLIN